MSGRKDTDAGYPDAMDAVGVLDVTKPAVRAVHKVRRFRPFCYAGNS